MATTVTQYPVSVVINTKNAATTLERTLRTVGFAQEIIVADMASVDGTLEIAKSFGARCIKVADVGYVEPARNQAIAAAKQPWVLIVDADEEVSEGLQKTIAEIVTGATEPHLVGDCYFIPRKNMIFNAWVQHSGWWPDYQLRLFKTGHVIWKDAIHSQPETRGVVVTLSAEENAALIHHNYSNISEFITRLDRYTSIEAQLKRPKNVSLTITPADIWRSFSDDFLSRFFAQHGYRDGQHGLSLSLLQAWYQSLTLLKRWEKAGFPVDQARDEETRQVMAALRHFQRDLSYWLADYEVTHRSGLSQLWWRLRRKLKV
jgi:(heptosyl)LPS beta-1,4-glucosyltransferase